MQPVLTDVLARRRDRAIAILLSLKERDCDQFLSREVSARLRKAILDQFNDFADFSLDIIRSLEANTDGTVVVNEHYLDKLDEIYRVVVGE